MGHSELCVCSQGSGVNIIHDSLSVGLCWEARLPSLSLRPDAGLCWEARLPSLSLRPDAGLCWEARLPSLSLRPNAGLCWEARLPSLSLRLDAGLCWESGFSVSGCIYCRHETADKGLILLYQRY